MPPKTKQARRAEDEESMCVVCTVQKSCAAQMECDHCVLCAECAFKVFAKNRRCPICRTCMLFPLMTSKEDVSASAVESALECAESEMEKDGAAAGVVQALMGFVSMCTSEQLKRWFAVLKIGVSSAEEFKSRPPAYFLEQAARAHPENKLIGEFLNGLGADAAVDFAPDFASDSDDDVSAEINILSYLLAACDDEKLTLLELSPVPDLGFAGGIAIAKILARNSHVREVDFCFKFKLDDAGALEMAKTLQSNKVIDTVRFHTNGFGTAGFEALMQAVGTSTVLKTVVFDHAVNTGPQGGIALAAAVRANSSVEQISVTSFDITNRGALELAEALKTNRTLKKMFLDIATIDQIAIDALFAAFKASKTLLSMEITDYTRRLTVASLARSEIVVIE